jgi:carboxyl-terminal processing protease
MMPRRNLFWLVVIGAVCLLCWQSVQSAPEERYQQYFEVFADTLQYVQSSHVNPPETKALFEGAMRGITKRLDRYSNYISPTELARFREEMRQEFGGIGIQITIADNQLTVVTPLPGTPAFRAGVLSGDRIVAIEGESTEGIQSTQQAADKLRGPHGTDVTITVLHEGSDEPQEITITRGTIHVASVKGDRYNSDGTWDYFIDQEHKIAYVRLEQFHDNTADELETAARKLVDEGMRSMILDLRMNPGGLLSAAVKVCDLFVSEGVIVSTKARGQRAVPYEAHRPGTLEGFDMVVLVNGRSASASEIVAACLQDHKRAVLIGERTWGKGSVQNILDLGNGRGAMKLTTASYHRPSGENIHRFEDATEDDVWGVKPNEGFHVTLAAPEEFEGKSKAEQRSLELQKMFEVLMLQRSRLDVLPRPGQEPLQREVPDRQLDRALEYLRSLQKEA